MKVQYSIVLLISLSFSICCTAQDTYFPENGSDIWATIDNQELGWCQENIDELLSLNNEGNTKALIILKNGKIALEEYYGDHEATMNWYWASAGKSLTACVVGVAQEEGILSIQDKTSDYLGDWTICDEANSNVTIRHQLTMTSGLDYTIGIDCTDPDCLDCLNGAGGEWFYHNAPYTLVQDVVANAAGENFNQYSRNAIGDKIGMNGFWVPVGDKSVYFSTARSMARFGLMISAGGDWNGLQIIEDKDYFNSMLTSSQDINPAYGYLWWLNGKDSFRLPGTTFTFDGSLLPGVADDAVMAIGKNGQYVIVIPSEETVIIRMGDNPDESLVPVAFLANLMDAYNNLECTNGVDQFQQDLTLIEIENSISNDVLKIAGLSKSVVYSITNYNGIVLQQGDLYNNEIDISSLDSSLYFISFYDGAHSVTRKFYKG